MARSVCRGWSSDEDDTHPPQVCPLRAHGTGRGADGFPLGHRQPDAPPFAERRVVPGRHVRLPRARRRHHGERRAGRTLIQSRSADLTANDWAASSAVNAIDQRGGAGLQPQSDLDWERLGISEQEALELQDAIERVWEDWVPTADVRGMMHFGDLQYLGLGPCSGRASCCISRSWPDPLRPLSLAIRPSTRRGS
ncbi:MAG: phage portal protein [Bilophila wadsworthia]